MKLKEAIEFVDDVKPNAFPLKAKIKMLSDVEKMIQSEIFLFAPEQLIEYDEGDEEIELLVSSHDRIYTDYLIAMIDWHNGEYENYANTIGMFNDTFSEFKRWFVSNYNPADTHGDIYESEDANYYDNGYQNVVGGKWRGYFLSAYGIAVKHGFVGSEEEWIFSLTAYGIAVNLGFVGSQEEWIASLKGEDGKSFEYEDFTPEQLSELKNQIAEAFFSEATQILDDVKSERTAVDNALYEAQKSMESAKEAAEEARLYTGNAHAHAAAAYGYALDASRAVDAKMGDVESALDAIIAIQESLIGGEAV